MMRIRFFTLICFFLSVQGYAQEINSFSNSISMDFGFPKLRVINEIGFIDENDNNIIDRGEASVVSFKIENLGEYAALDVKVRPQQLTNIPGLEIPEIIDVGDIQPGEMEEAQIGIGSDDTLGEGTVNLIFYIIENGTDENISVTFAINTIRE